MGDYNTNSRNDPVFDQTKQTGQTRVCVPDRRQPGKGHAVLRLQDVDDAVLEAELASRRESRRSVEQAMLAGRQAWAFENLSVLLLLAPEHETTNCSDRQPVSGYLDHGVPRCTRCYLLEIRQAGKWPANADLTIHIKEVKNAQA
jgi:hypothetical protein